MDSQPQSRAAQTAVPESIAVTLMSARGTHAQSNPGTANVDLPAGTKLGRHEVRALLGKGGMGAVYQAFDAATGRFVAIKVMMADTSRPVAWSRFLNEARLTAQLEHPCIVPVHEIGQDAKGRPYFAMKIVNGVSLKTRLAQWREALLNPHASRNDEFPLSHRLDILRKVGEAIAFAHSRGVIHRDLKPDNVMVGTFGEVQVMDWGLAKLVETSGNAADFPRSAPTHPDTPDDAQLTHDGAILGTPGFMSPEQAKGERESVGPLSDVFGMGALLYALLTSTPPYVAPTPMQAVMLAARGEVEPARARAAREFRRGRVPAIPRELDAVARKAMAKNPRRRYPTVKAMLADLDAFEAHRPVTAWRDSVLGRVQKWATRHPRATTAILMSVGFVLMAAVVGTGVLLNWARTEAELAKAEQREAAQRAKAELEALRREATEARLARVGALLNRERHAEVTAKITEFAQRLAVGRQSGQSFETIAASMRASDLDAYLSAYDALFAAHRLEPTVIEVTPEHYYQRAVLNHAKSKHEAAILDLTQAIQGLPQAEHAYFTRGNAHYAIHAFQAAVEDYSTALRLNSSNVEALTNRGMAYRALGRHDLALADQNQAVQLAPRNPRVRNNLGIQRLDMGDRAGIDDLIQATELSPATAEFHFNRAIGHRKLNDATSAEDSLSRAIVIDPTYVKAFLERGYLRWMRSAWQEAVEDYTQVILLAPTDSAAREYRAQAYLKLGNLVGAEADLTALIASKPDNELFRVDRGNLRYQLGRFEDALSDFEAVLKLNPSSWLGWSGKGYTLARLGRRVAAADAFEQALAHAPADQRPMVLDWRRETLGH